MFVIEGDETLDFEPFKRKLTELNHFLITDNIIQNLRTGDFRNSELFSLTSNAESLFLSDVDIWSNQYKNQDYHSEYYDVVNPENITEEKLYYSTKDKKNLDKIERLLSDNNLQQSYSKGKEHGLTEGIKIILRSEGFGTGKSSWVKQLARKTGRKILQVNLSSLKSTFFSESQKNIQNLFDIYKNVVDEILKSGGDREGNRIPILFIDEVSSLFVSRNNLNDSNNSAVNNTLHEMTSIILSNLDCFKGILICTSNTFSNSGYEIEGGLSRRLNIKLNIDTPDHNVRFDIIKDNLQMWLNEEECRLLSKEFFVTGGQIQVIKQRIVSDLILNNPITFEIVKEYFEVEQCGWKTKSCPIGFTK
jgi:hypothetical protein